MSGITSGVGLFSGINSQQIIEQLMSLEARPKTLAQQRIAQFQQQQTAFLDINSRLSSLRTAAASFRTNKSFQAMGASSSDDKVLTAVASAGAAPGTYQFIVDRLITSQQVLTRGFASQSAGLGLTSVTVESAKARLDRDVSLSELNGGAGVQRGRITITDSGGRNATVDLSKAATIGDVLSAINGNGTAAVTASVSDGKLIIRDNAGGSISVANAPGSTTASSLGIAGSATGTLTGSDIYSLSSSTSLSSLGDGLGLLVKPTTGVDSFQFSISVNGTAVKVNLGDVFQMVDTDNDGDTELTKTASGVTTLGGALERINTALSAAGFGSVTASVAPDGKRLRLSDSNGTAAISIAENGANTAAGLGLSGSATGTLTGTRLIGGLTSVLASKLNGGSGIGGDGTLNITTRDGNAFSVNITRDASLDEVMRQIETASGTVAGVSRLKVSLNTTGTGLLVTDQTGGTSNLIITGTNGSDTAAALGISTGASGVNKSTHNSGNLQRQYVGLATTVASLNNGKGIGTGTFRIIDSFGSVANVDIQSDTVTVSDLIDEINSRGIKVKARINSKGDGIELYEDVGGGSAGTLKIRVEDATGSVAKALNIAGEASGLNASNKIDGTAERVISFAATDSIATIAQKLTSAGAGISAAVINDGAGSTPFRLSLTSNAGGRDGRLVIDAGTFDLGLTTLEAGENSRVFFGSTDPARAVLLTSSSNTLDGVVSNVRIDLKGISSSPVNLTVAGDTASIEKSVKDFITAFNNVVDRISGATAYDPATTRRGPLLGDSLALSLRSSLFSTVQGTGRGISTRYARLSEVGVEVGAGGKLELDADQLRSALATDPAAVEALFAARVEAPGSTVESPQFTQLGVVGQVEELVRRYTDSVSGVLTTRTRSIDSQIQLQNRRIGELDVRLENRKAILQRQFLAMEQAIGQLQSQSTALGSIGSIRR